MGSLSWLPAAGGVVACTSTQPAPGLRVEPTARVCLPTYLASPFFLPPPGFPPRSAHLSDSVHELAALEELRLSGCAQVTSLRLHSGRLARLALRGARSLQELDLRCARLADVAITPVNPGLAAAASLK